MVVYPDKHDTFSGSPQSLEAKPYNLERGTKNSNTTSPFYHANAKCAYHSDSLGHDTNNCWALRNNIQDLIDAKEVEFDAPEKPNVISAPMPKHGHNAHAIEANLFVADVDDLMTLLPIIKMNLLKAGIFPGCENDCYLCSTLQSDCPLLKLGIQRLMDNQDPL